jgi:tRNA threonylcarbamoyladenosine biosynthesis protein TsaE
MSEKLVLKTDSPDATEALGEQLGRALTPGTVLALMGDLGAGKTTLTKGIARGLDVSDLVHSPTFNLIHEHSGRLPVYHFDLYRLTSPDQLEDLGYEEYFFGDGVCVIEWPEEILHMLPPDHIEVRILSGEENGRTLELTATGKDSESVLDNLEKEASR